MKKRRHPLAVVLGLLIVSAVVRTFSDSSHTSWRARVAEHDLYILGLKSALNDSVIGEPFVSQVFIMEDRKAGLLINMSDACFAPLRERFVECFRRWTHERKLNAVVLEKQPKDFEEKLVVVVREAVNGDRYPSTETMSAEFLLPLERKLIWTTVDWLYSQPSVLTRVSRATNARM